MKKTHKKIFGFAGLALVAAVTAFAAILPAPGASATNSITDTVQVRVIGGVPDVNFVSPAGNVTVSEPNQELKINYENVGYLTVSLKYTDKDGNTQSLSHIVNYDFDYVAGELTVPFNLAQYGYGIFEFTVSGLGYDGVPDTDAIVITYAPVKGEIEEGEDGSVNVDLDYDDDEVGRIEIDVYPPDGGEDPVYETTVTPPEDKVRIPFDDFGKDTGDYTISISVYDKDGNLLYISTLTYYYEFVPVPDTGALFKNLNISKEDYLVTGLLIFFVFAVVGFGIVARNRRGRK